MDRPFPLCLARCRTGKATGNGPHALYQSVVHGRMTVARQRALHLRIGEWKEEVYGVRAREKAGELAMHFERGHDYRRAVQYLGLAAENASRRCAPVEAI